MLILCYGITKSGSTLTFELVRGMLENAGHLQQRLPDEVVNPGHRINYIQPVTRKRLDDLLSVIGERRIAVKTHAALADPLFEYVEELQATRQLQVIASWRDPRDICLSMVDAGAHARAAGRKEFSLMTDIHVAANELSNQIPKFVKWASAKGTLALEYDVVAFSPDTAIERIESVLGVRCDREQAKRHAFEVAFTQKNKAEKSRFLRELNETEKAGLQERFVDFLQRMYEGEPAEWFALERARILQRCRSRSERAGGMVRKRRRARA